MGFSKFIDKDRIGEMVLDFWNHKLYKGMSDKENLHSDQIADISYPEFIKNPISSLKEAYIKIGLDMDIKTENNMEKYLAIQKNLKKKKHTYNLEEFGLSSQVIKDHFNKYLQTKPF